jgi:hypothetical protein
MGITVKRRLTYYKPVSCALGHRSLQGRTFELTPAGLITDCKAFWEASICLQALPETLDILAE